MKFSGKIKTRAKMGIRLAVFIILILYLFSIIKAKNFNEDIFSENKVYKHMEELSSEKYGGRKAGTDGNRLTLSYIEDYFKKLGIKPGGENNTYYQVFEDMIPEYNSGPALNLIDEKGNVIKKYTVGNEFREEFNGFGGNGNVKGKIFPTENSFIRYKGDEIRGKILLSRSSPSPMEIEYAIDNGASGIVSLKSTGLNKENPKMALKKDKSILISKVDSKTYFELLDYSRKNVSLQMSNDISFKNHEIPNIIGKIEGRKKDSGYIIFAASIDGLGAEYDGRHFPGTHKNTSGAAMMLEIARVIAEQRSRPDKTIVFIGYNNSEGEKNGLAYYSQNPVYPLDKTQMIIADSIGNRRSREVSFISNTDSGMALINRALLNGGEVVSRNKIFKEGFDNQLLIRENLPVVLVQDEPDLYITTDITGTYEDNMKNINEKSLRRRGEVFLRYLNYEVYGDGFDIFKISHVVVLIIFILGLGFIYFIETIYKLNPKWRLWRIGIEDIYYSTSYSLVQRFFKFVTPGVIMLLLLVFVASIPQNFKIVHDGDRSYSNLSLLRVLRRSLEYIDNLLRGGFGKTNNRFNVTNVMGYSIARSTKLLLSTMLFSFVFGILSGIINGSRKRESGGLKTLWTLIQVSLPDVFIVVVVQIFLIFLSRHNLFLFLMGRNQATRFIMPFICLSIIPTGYISRIVEVFVREEMKKEYIKAAKAKGLSRFQIMKNHILKGTIFKVMDSMNTILTMVISNLIIIEYLFPYPGVAYNMFTFYRERDRNGFMGLVLSLSFIYIFFILFFKAVIRIINPLKRRGEINEKV